LNENTPCMHPDVCLLIIFDGFQNITHHDLRINSPILMVQEKLVKLTFGDGLQLGDVIMTFSGEGQKLRLI
jgi:hypothetical protein